MTADTKASNAYATEFVKALYERFEATGSLEKALTRKELNCRTCCAQSKTSCRKPSLEYLRDKLNEGDERLYKAQLNAPIVQDGA